MSVQGDFVKFMSQLTPQGGFGIPESVREAERLKAKAGYQYAGQRAAAQDVAAGRRNAPGSIGQMFSAGNRTYQAAGDAQSEFLRQLLAHYQLVGNQRLSAQQIAAQLAQANKKPDLLGQLLSGGAQLGAAALMPG